jgi:hypothetical protein
MAESVPFPNREINDGQKEIFAQAIERLEPFLMLDTPTPERLLEMDERYDQDIEVHRIGHFVMNGTYFKLETSEVIEENAQGLVPKYILWSAKVRLGPEKVADQQFVIEKLFFVVKNGTDDSWVAEYEGHTTVQGPSDRHPRFCQAELMEDEEESDSEVPLEQRFTQARYTGVLALLDELSEYHVVDQVSGKNL